MALDQVQLGKLGIKSGVINLVLEVFGDAIPTPPLPLKDHEKEGEYFGLNEFYGAMVMLQRELPPTASGIRELIGGRTQTVHSNVAKLRKLIPDVFIEAPVKSDDPMVLLKQAHLKEERAVWRAKLEEQETSINKELEILSTSYEEKIRKLESKLAVMSGYNTALKETLAAKELKIDSLHNELQQEKVNKTKYNHLEYIATERLNELNELKEEKKQTRRAHNIERDALINSASDLRDERDAADNRAALLQRDLTAATELLLDTRESLDTAKEELADATIKLDQKEMKLVAEHKQNELIDMIADGLKPLSGLNDLIQIIKTSKVTAKLVESNDAKLLDLASAISSMHDSLKPLITKKNGKR